MALDANDHRPPFRQIADELRLAIAGGLIEPGGKLPSTRELMDKYQVASQTVQSAIRQLRIEGLVQSIQGRGTFVLDDVDPGTINTDPANSGPSPEYVALRDHLERLSAEMADIRKTLDEVVAKTSALPAKSPPAKKR